MITSHRLWLVTYDVIRHLLASGECSDIDDVHQITILLLIFSISQTMTPKSHLNFALVKRMNISRVYHHVDSFMFFFCVYLFYSFLDVVAVCVKTGFR